MDLRYTGDWPPAAVLAQYPNWVFALDEENEEGQDETTIKPEDQQLYISEETSFTAANATQANGIMKTAIIRMEDTVPSAIDVLDGTQWWSVQSGVSKKWEAVNETWLPEKERRPSISLGDRDIFPLVIKSKLSRSDGRILMLSIFPNGMTKLVWR